MESCDNQEDPSEVRVPNPRPKRLSMCSKKLPALSLNKSQGKTLASATQQKRVGTFEFHIDNEPTNKRAKFKAVGSEYKNPVNDTEIGYFEDLKGRAAECLQLAKFGWKAVKYYNENCV